jgi:aminoglycoside phosphotransferase (APT) family kinase protein
MVEERLGQPVFGADSQDGGFTNGFASRLRLADGSRVFVKAVSSRASPEVFASYRQEVLVARGLPKNVPAPRLRWTAEQDDWLVLAFDDVAGETPRRPWQPEQLRLVLDMLTPLAAGLTPAPAALPHLDTTADLDRDFSFWRRLAAGGPSADPRPVPEQWREHLRALAALEGDWAALAAGDTAVHFDLREDNLLLTEDGRVVVCDWNWLAIAAPWVDLVGLLISVHGDGLDADAVLAEHPLSREVPARAVDAFLAALAGYFTEAAARPPFPHSPWMRTHQAWWRDATLRWLALRLQH